LQPALARAAADHLRQDFALNSAHPAARYQSEHDGAGAAWMRPLALIKDHGL